MNDKTQPVATEADTKVVPSSGADSARNDGQDMDALLAEFDTATKTEPAKPAPAADATKPDTALLERLSVVEGMANRIAQSEFKQQMSETVNDVRGDVPKEVVDDDLVEAWLDARARKDPRLAAAWQQKDAKPREWSRIKSELGREFKKKFDKVPDREVTEDRAAVAAAVRGASSTKAPAEPAPDLGSMTPYEFQKYKNSLGL